MTLKVKINDSHFQYQPLSHTDKPIFLEVWVKMAKRTLKVKVNAPHFQY